MATYQVAAPESFVFSRPSEWNKWIRRFERFRIASGIDKQSEEAQVNTLIYSMGDQADDILRSFGLSAEDSKKYTVVKEKFESHFVKKRNVIFERARFNQRRQDDGEPVDAFITTLYELAEHCSYGALHDEMIRDRLVVGIRDAKLSEKLQLDPDLTLEKAITQVRQAETVKQQQPMIRGEQTDTPPIGAIRSKPPPTTKPTSANTGTRYNSNPPQSCSWCGKSPRHDRQHCAARDAVCLHCGKKGHFRSVCRRYSKRVRGISTDTLLTSRQEQDDEVESDDGFLGTVSSEDRQDNPWLVQLQLQGTEIKFHIDTGAEVTVISDILHKKLGNPLLTNTNISLHGPSNQSLQVQGKFLANIQYGEMFTKQPCYVVTGLARPLLGRPAIEKLNLLTRVNTIQESSPMKKYSKLFTGLGKLPGCYTIKLLDGAKPHSINVPRRVAVPLMGQVKNELERMTKLGVIARMDEPTEWCSGMVVVPKSNGQVRICVDLTKLNKSVCRERYPLPAVEQILSQLSGATVFTKLDANSGFWQIPLSPDSARLTTFMTPFGRYCFHRLPFGITSAPEFFQRQMSEMLRDKQGVVCLMDDVLVYGATQTEHDERLEAVLQTMQANGMTLNKDKCQFSQTRILFLGQEIDKHGIKPDPAKVIALQTMPPPTNLTDLRRFLGMTNHLSKFIPNLADRTKALRDLLIKDNEWLWEMPQQKAFEDVNRVLTSSPALALFNPVSHTIVSADASSYGLGAVLLQKQPQGELKPVAYISRSMTAAEQRYAQIEKESLALTWACERFSDYLLGLHFHINTDHKPLVPLFSTKNLEELPIRVQRFRLRMMRFNFSISHVPGKQLVIADTLSRAPAESPTDSDREFEIQSQAFVNVVLQSIPATEQRIQQIRESQQKDNVCVQVMRFCQSQWPDKALLPNNIQPYYSVRAELSVENGLLMRGCRLVIPLELRPKMLNKIHEGHLGITKCRARARQSIWWPGVSLALEQKVKNCYECCKYQSKTADPLLPSPLPELPWQKVGTDLFEWKKTTYLLIVDYYSRYIEISKLNHLTADAIVTHTKSIFARHGIPEVVYSDNGPQFQSSVYNQFASTYQFSHITSSPYFPQSNGEAERAVSTIKNLLKKEGDPYLALLAYRSTPLELGFSPSQLLMGRTLRSTIPTVREERKPRVPDLKLVRERDERLKERQKQNYDSHHRVKDHTPLKTGQMVWLPGSRVEAQVETQVAPRSYTVNTPQGQLRRNQRDLIELPDEQSSADANTSEQQLRRSTRISNPPNRLISDPGWK